MGGIFDDIFEFFTGSEEATETRKVNSAATVAVNTKDAKAKALKESRERNSSGFKSAAITSPLGSGSSVGGSTNTQLLNPLQK